MNTPETSSHQQHLSSWTIELIQAGQEVWLEANGYSMFPCLKPGDKIKLSPCSIDEIVPGDLIVFQRKKYFVLHRVKEKQIENGATVLISKGDSEFNCDEPVNLSNYLGKITEATRGEKDLKIGTSGSLGQIKTMYNWFRKKIKVRYNWF